MKRYKVVVLEEDNYIHNTLFYTRKRRALKIAAYLAAYYVTVAGGRSYKRVYVFKGDRVLKAYSA